MSISNANLSASKTNKKKTLKVKNDNLENEKISKKRQKVEIIKTFYCTAQVRYHQEMINCQVKILQNGNCEVEFKEPVRAVAVGQSIVFYDNDTMIGGGIIDQKLI